MDLNRNWTIAAGVALWLPLLLSFAGAMSLAHLPGLAFSQLAMVALLVGATLLLGMLIGRSAQSQGLRTRS